MKSSCLLVLVLFVMVFPFSAQAIPIAEYHFNGNADDSSSNGYDGIPYNGVDFSAYGIASFDGKDDYIEVPNTTDWTFPFGLTLMARVRLTDYNHDVMFVGNHISGNNTGYGLMVREDHFCFLLAATSYNSIQTSETYRDGQWYDVVGIFDPGTGIQSLYVDGELKASQITVGPYPDPSPANLRIGAYTEGQYTEKFHGDLDEVSICDYPFPEPGTLSLLALGGLSLMRRRRR